ncbi:DUF4396 domain-containing protein [Kitasatospora sp. NPDC127111]|uniref:DUF4396 domain-containing protein n=1 Tax=Kitasatospora sp. NPDC127111 TaxID=3345363 RepID=UPI003642A92D
MAHPAQHEHQQHTGQEHHGHQGHEGHPGHSGHEGHEGHADHAAHGRHAGHAGHGGHAAGASWRMAALATLHCLTGCAIGEVLGMVLGTAFGLHNGATVVLSVLLAFVFGYALTMRGVLKAGLDVRAAVKVALAADTVSILVMELIDNSVMVTVPGAMDAGLGDLLFWIALAGSLALAFALTVPVNKWMIGRGRGHAVVHAHHQH